MKRVRCLPAALPRRLGPMLPWAFARLQALASLRQSTTSSREGHRDTRTQAHRSELGLRRHTPRRSEPCEPTMRRPSVFADPLTRSTRDCACVPAGSEDRDLLLSRSTQQEVPQNETAAAGATAFHPLPLRPGDVTDETNTGTRICTHCWGRAAPLLAELPPKRDSPRTTEVDRRRAEARDCLFNSRHHRTGETTTALLRPLAPHPKNRSSSCAGTLSREPKLSFLPARADSAFTDGPAGAKSKHIWARQRPR